MFFIGANGERATTPGRALGIIVKVKISAAGVYAVAVLHTTGLSGSRLHSHQPPS